MKKFTTNLVLILVLIFGLNFTFGQSVMISQYIETDSGGKPKGIEIYNLSGADIVFSTTNNLIVHLGSNGNPCSALPGTAITSGTLEAGKVWVIGTNGGQNKLIDFAIANGTDLSGTTTYNFNFNGDDALKLYLGGKLQDVFGECGIDPGSHWNGGGVSTKNHNISIKSEICSGTLVGWSDPSLRYENTANGSTMTGFGNAPVKITTTWNGSAWNPSVPDATMSVIIDGLYNTSTNSSIEACDCTINSGKKIIVTNNHYLKVVNSIINNGTVAVRNKGSIVQVNDDAKVTGTNFKIKKKTPIYIEYDFTYWSSPIENAQLGTVFAASEQNRIFDFTTANFDDSDNDSFDDDNDDWGLASGSMTVGKGYIVEGEGADWPFDSTNIATNLTQTVTFIGKINNGPLAVPLSVFADANLTDSYDNQNLIGNPYPSAIDIKKLQTANNSIFSGTYYFWTHGTEIGTQTGNTGPDAYNFTNDDYATATTNGSTFNSTASTGTVSKTAPEFIASGQGFFVDVIDNGTASANIGNVIFNNDMRVTGNNNQFRNTNTIYDRVWLNMTNDNGIFRQILIGFFNDATDTHDKGIDGKRLENGENFDFYSLMSNTRYAIQGFSTLVNEKIVTLGVEAPETGSLTISIDRFEGDLENVNIYLKDNLLNNIHDLKIADYVLDINQAGEFNERFELVFSKTILATSNEIILNTDLIISNINDEIYFKMLNGNNITSIQAFDIIGKLVVKANPNNSNFSIQTNVNKGTVLFIKVQLENGQILTKKFIKL